MTTLRGIQFRVGPLLFAAKELRRDRGATTAALQAYWEGESGDDPDYVSMHKLRLDDDQAVEKYAQTVLTDLRRKRPGVEAIAPTRDAIVEEIQRQWAKLENDVPASSTENDDEATYSEGRRYVLRHGRLYAVTATEDGSPPAYRLLLNAAVRITRDIEASDGDGDTERRIEISIELAGGRSYLCTLPAREFNGPTLSGRLLEAVGPRLLIEPGAERRLAHAISSFGSPDPEQMRTHTGWYVNEDKHLYFLDGEGDVIQLHAEKTSAATVRVALPPDPAIAAYMLARDRTPCAGWAALMRLRATAPPAVTLPLIAQTYLAPLASLIGTPSRPLLFLRGQTGTRKTELARLAAGAFSHAQNTADLLTWSSTYGSWEAVSHTLKDVLLILDDYKPSVVRIDQVTRFIQNYSTSSGRQRRRSDMTLMPSMRPRSLILATGEDSPNLEPSVSARILYVDLKPGDVDLDALTAAQRGATDLHGLTIGFLQWLTQTAEVRTELPELLSDYRDWFIQQLHEGVNVGRIAENLALLQIAWQTLGLYASKTSLLSADVYADWDEEGRQTLMTLGRTQIAAVAEQALDRVFLDALQSLFDQGVVALTTDKDTDDATLIGGGALVGHLCHDGIALFAGTSDGGTGVVAYRLVQEHFRRRDEKWPHTWEAVGRYLKQRGWLVTTEADRITTQRRINKQKRRVILLRQDALSLPVRGADAEETL